MSPVATTSDGTWNQLSCLRSLEGLSTHDCTNSHPWATRAGLGRGWPSHRTTFLYKLNRLKRKRRWTTKQSLASRTVPGGVASSFPFQSGQTNETVQLQGASSMLAFHGHHVVLPEVVPGKAGLLGGTSVLPFLHALRLASVPGKTVLAVSCHLAVGFL